MRIIACYYEKYDWRMTVARDCVCVCVTQHSGEAQHHRLKFHLDEWGALNGFCCIPFSLASCIFFWLQFWWFNTRERVKKNRELQALPRWMFTIFYFSFFMCINFRLDIRSFRNDYAKVSKLLWAFGWLVFFFFFIIIVVAVAFALNERWVCRIWVLCKMVLHPFYYNEWEKCKF